MGACTSKKVVFVVNNDVQGQDELAMEVFLKIGLEEKDIDTFYRIFCEIDLNGTGSVRPKEIFSHFNVELGNFEDGIFAIFDEGKTKLLNFMEFVCAMWNLLTLEDKFLAVICYLMKDPTGALRIKYPDVKDMIEMMHKRKVDSTPALQAMYANLKGNFGGEISIKELCDWAGDNLSLLTPLLVLQIKMRRYIIGEKYWLRKTRERTANAEMSKFDFTRKLATIVKARNDRFRHRALRREQEQAVEKQRNKFTRGNSRPDMERKQSLMLKSFNLGIAKQEPAQQSSSKGKSSDATELEDSNNTMGSPTATSSSRKRIQKAASLVGKLSSSTKNSSKRMDGATEEVNAEIEKQSSRKAKTGVSFAAAAAANEEDNAATAAASNGAGTDNEDGKKSRPKSADKLRKTSSKRKLSNSYGDDAINDADKKKSRPKSASRSKSGKLEVQQENKAGSSDAVNLSTTAANDSAPPLPPSDGVTSSPPKLKRTNTSSSKNLRKAHTSPNKLLLNDNDDDAAAAVCAQVDSAVAAGLESSSKKPRPKSAAKGGSKSPVKRSSSSKKIAAVGASNI